MIPCVGIRGDEYKNKDTEPPPAFQAVGVSQFVAQRTQRRSHKGYQEIIGYENWE